MKKTFTGISASIGAARGTIKTISSEEDFGKVNNGDIVVVYRSSPAWAIPLMRGAGGMICEVGGKVSHIAIICRELGIPCVMGIHGIFEELKDGDLVTVDCENGEVHKYG